MTCCCRHCQCHEDRVTIDDEVLSLRGMISRMNILVEQAAECLRVNENKSRREDTAAVDVEKIYGVMRTALRIARRDGRP